MGNLRKKTRLLQAESLWVLSTDHWLWDVCPFIYFLCVCFTFLSLLLDNAAIVLSGEQLHILLFKLHSISYWVNAILLKEKLRQSRWKWMIKWMRSVWRGWLPHLLFSFLQTLWGCVLLISDKIHLFKNVLFWLWCLIISIANASFNSSLSP